MNIALTPVLLALALLTSCLALPSRNNAIALARDTNDSAPAETTVYICQNYNWTPPCILVPLGSSENDQQNFWMAPAPGGPGPFQDENYTIGSWGPSKGVTTYWVDHEGNKSTPLTYPGVAVMDAYWQNNVWTWWPSWET